MGLSAGSLSSFDVISFDVYDTLVLRPYVRPEDLFEHMEVISQCDGFAKKRVAAESEARRRYGREITLDEIYSGMDTCYQKLKTLETDMECQIPVANPEILDLFNELIGMGKRVVLISDMYLPKDVISSMLAHCGYSGYDELYVSSEFGFSKHNGKLYGKVLNDLSIDASRMYHIGDNKHSDHDVPKRLGIDAYHYIRPIDLYKHSNPNEYGFYKKKRTLARSILIGVDIITRSKYGEKIWYDMGRRYGGPLAMSYSLNIVSNVKNGKILFASRDGYNLKRIIDKHYPNCDTKYVYAQRLLMDVLTDIAVPYGDVEVPDSKRDRYRYAKFAVSLKRILRFFAEELDVTVPDDRESIIKVYKENIDRIDALRKERLEQYRNELLNMCGSDEVHLVDCTTMKYSSQRLIEYALGRRIKGHYLVTLSQDDRYDHDAMCDWHSPAIGWMNVDIPEFYLSSPELPLTGWNGGPVFGNKNDCETFRSEIYDHVSDGELQYADDYLAIFKGYAIPLDYWSVVGWSKLSAVRGTEYYNNLKQIRWASDPDHTEYAPLITGAGSAGQILKKLAVSIIDKMNSN